MTEKTFEIEVRGGEQVAVLGEVTLKELQQAAREIPLGVSRLAFVPDTVIKALRWSEQERALSRIKMDTVPTREELMLERRTNEDGSPGCFADPYAHIDRIAKIGPHVIVMVGANVSALSEISGSAIIGSAEMIFSKIHGDDIVVCNQTHLFQFEADVNGMHIGAMTRLHGSEVRGNNIVIDEGTEMSSMDIAGNDIAFIGPVKIECVTIRGVEPIQIIAIGEGEVHSPKLAKIDGIRLLRDRRHELSLTITNQAQAKLLMDFHRELNMLEMERDRRLTEFQTAFEALRKSTDQ